jgi:hypothetical protein
MAKRKITGQTIQWPKEKSQDTIQWPKEKLKKEQKNIQ